MTQQWLTVLGLALDFTGFMLLLREWWLAFFNESHQLEMAEQLERMRAMRTMIPRDPGQHNPYESLERVQDEQAIRKAALQFNVPCVTTITGAEALVEAIGTKKTEKKVTVRSLQEIHAQKELVADERG